MNSVHGCRNFQQLTKIKYYNFLKINDYYSGIRFVNFYLS
jgi:hypothetical protein